MQITECWVENGIVRLHFGFESNVWLIQTVIDAIEMNKNLRCYKAHLVRGEWRFRWIRKYLLHNIFGAFPLEYDGLLRQFERVHWKEILHVNAPCSLCDDLCLLMMAAFSRRNCQSTDSEWGKKRDTDSQPHRHQTRTQIIIISDVRLVVVYALCGQNRWRNARTNNTTMAERWWRQRRLRRRHILRTSSCLSTSPLFLSDIAKDRWTAT